MRNKKFTHILLTVVLLFTLLSGCGKQTGDKAVAPFSDATWNYTVDDVKEMAGDDYTTTDSVYGGDCYILPGTYMDYDGSVKYMFDDDDALVCIAFACTNSDPDKISELYEKINKDVTDTYGEGTHTAKHSSNSGDKWIRDEGNILLLVLSTDDASALQYSYLHPSVSRDADGNLSTE
jgi:hypothetical protein